jgi:hypothetical protein
MEGEWVQVGSPQWWWKYVLPSGSSGLNQAHPVPWSPVTGWAEGHGVPWSPPVETGGPRPEPWRRWFRPEVGRTSVVGAIISAVSIKQVAQGMREGDLGGQLAERSDRTISALIDDWCGTEVRPWPWPWPPPWVLGAVEELALVANSLQEGSMREELLGVAGRMMEQAVSETGLG